jgi:hypothetical protein
MPPLTKQKTMTNVKEILGELVQQVVDGNADPLEAYIHLKDVEKYLKQCNECVEPLAYQEADKWSEKTFTYKGAEIQKKSAAGRWDFTNVSLYKESQKRLKQIEELAKVAAKGGTTVIDEPSGEVVEPAIYTAGKAIISVKLLNS